MELPAVADTGPAVADTGGDAVWRGGGFNRGPDDEGLGMSLTFGVPSQRFRFGRSPAIPDVKFVEAGRFVVDDVDALFEELLGPRFECVCAHLVEYGSDLHTIPLRPDPPIRGQPPQNGFRNLENAATGRRFQEKIIVIQRLGVEFLTNGRR